MKRVAIVGGGPGGLFSTFLLEQKCSEELAITLFESDTRLGGKVLTRKFAAAPVLYEAGVAELYRYGDDPLWQLVTKRLGLATVNMAGSAVVFEGQVLRGEADLMRHFGAATTRALTEFRQRAREARPYKNFYDGGWPADNRHPWMKRSLRDLLSAVPDQAARRFLQVLIHSDLATEPHLTHGLYGIDNYLLNESDYCQLYAICGGITRLTQALADRVSARVMLDTPVSGIEKAGNGAYRVSFDHHGGRQSAVFDAVVVALPIYALRQLAWSGPPLQTAIQSHVAHYEDAAHYLRITALFQEPFWRARFNESWFIHDAFGGCCVYDEGARQAASTHGVLSWLLAGSDALAMSRCSDQVLIARALDSLPRAITGGWSATERFIEGHVNRWIGMVYGMPGGRPLAGSKERHCPEPEGHRGLVLVGDYLFDSTINAAFDSANIASQLVADYLSA